MRKALLSAFILFSFSANAQWTFYNHINFDSFDSTYSNTITIDTQYHHNLWQIGKPSKSVFTSALSAPNAMVTDTTHPYPASDTSVFTLKLPVTIPLAWPLVQVYMMYKLDIDSNAIAKLEMSTDSGMHWYNTADSLPATYSWLGGIPTDLTHSATGWTYLGFTRPPFSPYSYDTVLFRFSLVSDSSFTGHDGWMIDDIFVIYFGEGLSAIAGDNTFSVYPNPSRGNVYIQAPDAPGDAAIKVFDMEGRMIYATTRTRGQEFLNLPLPDGNYILQYDAGNATYKRKITIIK